MRHASAERLNEVPTTPRGPLVVGLLGLAGIGAAVAVVTSSLDGLVASAAVLAVVLGCALLRWPWLGVAFIFTTLLFKYPEFVQRMPVSPTRIVSGILLVLLLVGLATRQRMDFVTTPTYLGFAVVLAMFAFNLLVAGSEDAPAQLAALDLTDRSLNRIVAHFLLLTLFGAFIRTPRHLLAMVAVFIAAILVTVPGAVTHTYDVTAQGQQSLERARALATMGIQSAENANRLALIAVMGLSLFWFAVQQYRNGLLRAFAWLVIPVLVLTVFLSGSRSGVLNLGLLLALLLLQSGVRPGRLAAVALFGVVAAATLWFLVPQPIVDRITTLLPSEQVTSATRSIELRELMLQMGAKLFSQSPFTGVGVGNVRWMAALDPQSGGLGLTMHNAYLLVLVEGGVLFLGAYLLLFWLTWRSLQRTAGLAAVRPEIGLGWLVRATRTNLVLLLTFSLFAEAWNETPFLLTLCSAMALAVLYGQRRPSQPLPGTSPWVPSPSST
jgi:hypothetical protein